MTKTRLYLLLLVAVAVFLGTDLLGVAWYFYKDALISFTDFGIVTQLAHNTCHGRFLRTSLSPVLGDAAEMSILGEHTMFSTLLYFPPYCAFPSPFTITAWQIIICVASIFPAYFYAQRRLNQPLLAFAITLALFFHFNFLVQVHTVHNDTLALCLLLWAFFFRARGQAFLFHFCLFLLMNCKENHAVFVAALGLYLFLEKDKRAGIAWMAVGTFWFLFSIWVVIPHFSAGFDPLARFRGSGGLIGLETFRRFFDLAAWQNYAILLLPFLFLPLLAPKELLMAIPGTALLFTGGTEIFFRSPTTRYATPLLGVFFLATVAGAKRLRGVRPQNLVAFSLLAFILAEHFLFPDSTPFRAYRLEQKRSLEAVTLGQVGRMWEEVFPSIPPEARVVVSNRLVNYVAERREVYVFPKNWRDADYLLIDRRPPLYWPFNSKTELLQTLEEIKTSGLFEPVVVMQSFLLLRRSGIK